jgi:hypothetical protein
VRDRQLRAVDRSQAGRVEPLAYQRVERNGGDDAAFVVQGARRNPNCDYLTNLALAHDGVLK